MTDDKRLILVLGATGQVGNACVKLWGNSSDVHFASRSPGKGPRWYCTDLNNLDQVRDVVGDLKPTIVVNAAAYTAVDRAEDDPGGAFLVNAEAPGLLANLCRDLRSWLIHYSTDYVFDGTGTSPLKEDSPNTYPLGVYGESKLAGERLIQSSGVRHTILRTSWVFSHHGQNFMKTMLRLGTERKELKVVADQWGAPTSARFLAATTSRIIESSVLPSDNRFQGVFHACCGGETTWHGFAAEIFRQAREAGRSVAVESLLPITTCEYPLRAKRPLNSRLDCRKIQRALDIKPVEWPSWQSELAGEFALLS